MESTNISALHSTSINVDISAEGTPTFNAGMFGLTGTEIIYQYSYAIMYGAFSPTLLISSQSTKYHSTLVPLYDASFDEDDSSLTLRFALLNYDNYNIDMLQLVALSNGEVTASFYNWVANNASQVVTMAGGNGGYQTQEQLNTSVLTSLASKANISGSAEQVFNVATPVSDTNDATKAYVDTKSTALPTLLFDDTQILAGSYDQVLEAYNLNKPFLVLHKERGTVDYISYNAPAKCFNTAISYTDIYGSITERFYTIKPNGRVDSAVDEVMYAKRNGWSDETFAVASPISPNDATPKSYVDSAIIESLSGSITSGQVTGLDTALAGKSNTGHTHAPSDINNFNTAVAGVKVNNAINADSASKTTGILTINGHQYNGSGNTTISITDNSTTQEGHYTPSVVSTTYSGVITGLTVDSKKHIVGVSTGSVSSTDTAVTQNAVISTAGEYPIMLGSTTVKTQTTGVLNKGNGITYNPSTSGLTNVGNTYSTAFYATSDERLKNFTKDIVIEWDNIKKIPKKYFTWKNNESNKLEIGTSSQEVQKIFPEIVSGNKILSVEYEKLGLIALAAIDKLKEEKDDEISILKEEIKLLKKEIELLKV